MVLLQAQRDPRPLILTSFENAIIRQGMRVGNGMQSSLSALCDLKDYWVNVIRPEAEKLDEKERAWISDTAERRNPVEQYTPTTY